jgi:uncharacterized protein with von Willebrand factor type A (vWA) domain
MASPLSPAEYAFMITNELSKPQAEINERLVQHWLREQEKAELKAAQEKAAQEKAAQEKEKEKLTARLMEELSKPHQNQPLVEMLKKQLEGILFDVLFKY